MKGNDCGRMGGTDARGEETEESDIDIAIILEDFDHTARWSGTVNEDMDYLAKPSGTVN